MLTPDTLISLLKTEISVEKIAEWKLLRDSGNTQRVEREYMIYIHQILDNHDISYTPAPSQQSRDLRNLGGVGIDLEIKMTTGNTIKCNDTLPSERVYYLIIYTGNRHYPPQLIIERGDVLIRGSEWVYEYIERINSLRDAYGRGTEARRLSGPVSVYPRPNIDIKLKDTGLLVPY